MSREFGVLWRHQSGRTWVSAGYTEQGATATAGNVTDWPAYDAEVVVREVGDWLPLSSLPVVSSFPVRSVEETTT